jgi:hypothetical protein
MSELSEIHKKIDGVNITLAGFKGSFEEAMKHVASKEFVKDEDNKLKDEIIDRIEKCSDKHKPQKNSIIPQPSKKIDWRILLIVALSGGGGVGIKELLHTFIF